MAYLENPGVDIAALEALFERLSPIRGSLMGAGLAKTLDTIAEIMPLDRIEVPSGTQCFDWTVPREWRVGDAYVVAPNGERAIDAGWHPLHLVEYSAPFRGSVSREELERHLFSRPDLPEAIPYVATIYEPNWGFALAERDRAALPVGTYDVIVDTEFVDGAMVLAEAILPGEDDTEILVSAVAGWNALANSGLSGLLAAVGLYRALAAVPRRRHTYRFVFAPEAIGCIAYLSVRGAQLRRRLVAGYVLASLADSRPLTYKASRRGTSLADRVARYVLRQRDDPRLESLDFYPFGSHERQYCAPGFDLPVGTLMRSVRGTCPEEFTSLDNRDFVSFERLGESVEVLVDFCAALEANRTVRTVSGFGEPQLGRRGLYPSAFALKNADPRDAAAASELSEALIWLLSLSDGTCDLITIAERSGLSLAALADAADRGLAEGLVEPAAGAVGDRPSRDDTA